MKWITTSWDDGHPLDFRIAALLDKYKLQGTFYIPQANEEHIVMTEAEISTLAKNFEIGGHTLNHIRLSKKVKNTHEYEIAGSFKWLKELLNHDPISFCFPGGVFDKSVVETVKKAGYQIFRTVELLSINSAENNTLLPTSLQLYEHSRFTYVKHLVKRRRGRNLIQWLQLGSESNLLTLTDNYLNEIEKRGTGCFHLWGHSWEIEEYSLWGKLEKVLQHLAGRSGFQYIPNRDLLKTKSPN